MLAASEKEHLELLNLRKKVVSQRGEIKRLNAVIKELKEKMNETSR